MKIGDTVQLKSGGPVMTVEKILDDGPLHKNSVTATWFLDGVYNTKTFARDALKLAAIAKDSSPS